MTCREVLDFLMAYLDNEVDSMTRVAFEHHLSICRCCRDYLRNYQDTVRLSRDAFRDAEQAQVPEELVRAILRATGPQQRA